MKKILVLLLAMTMVFALCACGGSSGDTAAAPDSAAAPAAPAEGGNPPAQPEGEASGEPSGEPPADVPQSSAMANEAHGGTPGATSEADYQAYLKAWLAYEQSVNSTMSDENVAEFISLIDAGNYTDFPAEMLFSGMLVTGSAMTYDEFVAANGVY